jgi:putative FmdB family regulatory protein
MPIYEFACPKCRRIFSFLSKRVRPERTPTCPKCGGRNLQREVSRFALLKGAPEPAPSAAAPEAGQDGPPMPDLDDARMERAMGELERDMEHLDENNPRHMAHMLRKMQQALPPGSMPKDMDVAIRRLEQGEDPEKIEEDMGDALSGLLGDEPGAEGGSRGGAGSFSKDPGLYDY